MNTVTARRRARRMVVSVVSAAGVVAAVAVGATALVDFTNTAGPDIAPAVTPTDTAEPTEVPSPPVATEPQSDPTDDPTEPTADPTEPAEDTTGESDHRDDPAVFDPESGFGGIQIGMTIAELEALDGVSVTPFSEDEGGTEYCFGSFESAQVNGMISVRAAMGEEPRPAESPEDFVVTTITPQVPVVTPEGVGWGSGLDAVRDAYPQLEEGDTFAAFAYLDAGNDLRWVFDDHGTDTIASVTLDGGQICAD